MAVRDPLSDYRFGEGLRTDAKALRAKRAKRALLALLLIGGLAFAAGWNPPVGRLHDFTNVSDEDIQTVTEKLNRRPRKVLGFRTPNEAFFENKPVVALHG